MRRGCGGGGDIIRKTAARETFIDCLECTGKVSLHLRPHTNTHELADPPVCLSWVAQSKDTNHEYTHTRERENEETAENPWVWINLQMSGQKRRCAHRPPHSRRPSISSQQVEITCLIKATWIISLPHLASSFPFKHVPSVSLYPGEETHPQNETHSRAPTCCFCLFSFSFFTWCPFPSTKPE